MKWCLILSLRTDLISLNIFQICALGPFLLTRLLLDDMKKTAKETGIQGKVVNVSSIGHALYTYAGGIRFNQLNDESRYK